MDTARALLPTNCKATKIFSEDQLRFSSSNINNLAKSHISVEDLSRQLIDASGNIIATNVVTEQMNEHSEAQASDKPLPTHISVNDADITDPEEVNKSNDYLEIGKKEPNTA